MTYGVELSGFPAVSRVVVRLFARPWAPLWSANRRPPQSLWILLCAVAQAPSGGASAKIWRWFTVAPEHRCSPYERARASDGSREAAITTASPERGLRPWRGARPLVVSFTEPAMVKI